MNWTLEYENGKGCIRHNGQVQPFGALFYNMRRDSRKTMERSIRLLNSEGRFVTPRFKWRGVAHPQRVYRVTGFDRDGIMVIKEE